jgi:hypothetical protein
VFDVAVQARILVLTSTPETARYCNGLFRGVARVITVRVAVLEWCRVCARPPTVDVSFMA